MNDAAYAKKIKEKLGDIEWRLDHLYRIQDKFGKEITFVRNTAQLRLWKNLHSLNVILKTRQLGFSTFIAILILDDCLFNSNQNCNIIDLKLTDAKKKLKKIKFAYDRLPEWLIKERDLTTENKEALEMSNESTMAVGTSHRGGTSQILHVSEFGAISARRPDVAREIVTGAFNTVAPGNFIFVESTAEGRSGYFHDMVYTAKKLDDAGEQLTDMDFKLHFFPWFEDEANVLPATAVTNYTAKEKEYFAKLEEECNIKLTGEQKAWWSRKKAQQGDDMAREYPGTIDEAFESVTDGAYYSEQMLRARKEKRITRVPYDESLQTFTSWDLGMNDTMSIWFIQVAGREYRVFDYYANSGKGFPWYAQILKEKGYYYSAHLMPHDANVRELDSGRSRVQSAEKRGIKPVIRVDRAKNGDEVINDIDHTRAFIGQAVFDKEACHDGILGLEAYSKEWDERLSTFLNRPRHDWASHIADGLRTFVRALNTIGLDSILIAGDAYNPANMVLDQRVY